MQRAAGGGLASLAWRTLGLPRGLGAGSSAPHPREREGNSAPPSPAQGWEIEAPPAKRGKGFLPSPGVFLLPSASWQGPHAKWQRLCPAALAHLCAAGACPSPGWDVSSSEWTRPPPRAGSGPASPGRRPPCSSSGAPANRCPPDPRSDLGAGRCVSRPGPHWPRPATPPVPSTPAPQHQYPSTLSTPVST